MRGVERQITIDAEDDVAFDIIIARADAPRFIHAGEERLERHAARKMRLWIEHDLDIAHIFVAAARQMRQRDVVKIPLGAEHQHAFVVMLDECLQIGRRIRRLETLRGAHLIDAGIGQRHAVALRQLPFHRRRQRAFDMQMQLGFRQGSEEIAIGGRDVGEAG